MNILKSDFVAKYRAQIITVVSFFAGLFLILIVADNWIMPWLIHSRTDVRIPNVIGKTLQDAQSTISSSGLTYKVTKEIYSEKIPAGSVLNQIPAAGMNVKDGRQIFLIMSKGKELTPAPYLVGTNIKNAATALSQRGLEIGNVFYQTSDFVGKDTIISQSKQAGSNVPYGDKVDLVVSKGTSTAAIAPMLIGMNYDEALQSIKSAGLSLGNVVYQKSETYLPNVIIDQNPKSDESVTNGATINITVSK